MLILIQVVEAGPVKDAGKRYIGRRRSAAQRHMIIMTTARGAEYRRGSTFEWELPSIPSRPL